MKRKSDAAGTVSSHKEVHSTESLSHFSLAFSCKERTSTLIGLLLDSLELENSVIITNSYIIC